MTAAWKSNIPSGRKMVLLALCDNANDQGECFPSISMLSEKCSMSERSVFSHIAYLEKSGAIKRENRLGRSTVYHLDPCKFCTPKQSLTPATVAGVRSLTPAEFAPPPLQNLHPTPATVAPTPANSAPITIKEPDTNTGIPNTTPEGVEVSVWRDFQKLRKSQRAPITDTALAGIRREAGKAGVSMNDALQLCCERSWRGFKAEWVADKPGKAIAPTYRERDRLAGIERWEQMTGEIHPERAKKAQGMFLEVGHG